MNAQRQPLAIGNRYVYPGYPGGFKITAVCLPGHPEHDGGLPGVAVKFIKPMVIRGGFYPCNTEDEFWLWEIFKAAVSE